MTKLEQMQEKVLEAAHTGTDSDIKNAVTEVWNEAIKECEGCVPREMEERPTWENGDPQAWDELHEGHNSCREQTLQAIRQMAYKKI